MIEVLRTMALSLACLAGSLGCRDPQNPLGPPSVTWVDPNGRLTRLRPQADSVIVQVARTVDALLDVTGVTITVVDDPRQAIGGYGLGGRTFSASDVRLFVDPTYPGIDTVLARRLSWLTAHELHHAARWRSAGYGSTLLEAMVSEGMADRFAEEVLGGALPPWSHAFGPDSTALLLGRARPEFDSRSYNHAKWFFDADPSLPRWTGYTLGYRLVTTAIAASPGSNARSLVAEPASRFRP